MTTPEYRALCAELAGCLPEMPTDFELVRAIPDCWPCTDAPRYDLDDTIPEQPLFSVFQDDVVEYARAVLARWGRPAIEPVPEGMTDEELEATAAVPPRPGAGRGGSGVNVRISFGALSPRIEEQLQEQGLGLDMEPLQRQYLQRDVDEVSRLRVRCVLTESESDKARKRIMQIIKKQARPL
jgi:hypothetical protein